MVATLCALQVSVVGQVLINEYSASNLNAFLDQFGNSEDWIELYNAGDSAADVSGYHVSDKVNNPTKWEVPAGTIIPAKGYLLVYCSGRDGKLRGEYHTNFRLTQTEGSDQVVWADPAGNIIDMTDMELTLTEHSRARVTDGADGGFSVCVAPTPASTNLENSMYAGYTETPTIDIAAGFYQDEVVVTVTNNDPNSTLRYTTDGTNPTVFSAEYTGPITITSTSVVKALAFPQTDDVLQGKMDFATYFINEDDFTVAVFSVAADDVIDLANGQGFLIPVGSLEYFNLEGEREAVAFGSLNRHGQDSWALDHRSLDWVTRDEMGYTKAVNARLFSFSERDEYQKFMFRNSGDDNYPAISGPDHEGSTHIRDEYVQTLSQEGGMKLDTRAVERVVLFLNGQYWGLYGMRDRPVDHDYTDFYYDQGKYDLHYLSTWGTTETEYGGQPALDDWVQLRDFIMNNDMAIADNYAIVKDQLQTQSLIDYMLANLNVVAKDWLNYNTGWWRGTDEDGDHKKWGYILWDLDATFGYYINYTGVPDETPNAEMCDIDDISDFMDQFFGNGGGFDVSFCPSVQAPTFPHESDDPLVVVVIESDFDCCFEWGQECEEAYQSLVEGSDPTLCATILSGSSPYPADDSLFVETISILSYCCSGEWDGECQQIYDQLAAGQPVSVYNGELDGIRGNVGQHEKIFLKLIEESEVFRQEYYSRQADLINTVYSCENMTATLEKMLDVIRPEMPRQIERWGGTVSEWEEHVSELREFIEQRCENLHEGMTNCYDITGPYALTLMTRPEGVGDDIQLNSLTIEDFPWTGDYFGNMENLIEADRKDGDYLFSHWESTNGNIITPSPLEREASINLAGPDTLIAVYTSTVATEEISEVAEVTLFPNPTGGIATLRYTLEQAAIVSIDIIAATGAFAGQLQKPTAVRPGTQTLSIDFEAMAMPYGVYFVRMNVDGAALTRRVTYLR